MAIIATSLTEETFQFNMHYLCITARYALAKDYYLLYNKFGYPSLYI